MMTKSIESTIRRRADKLGYRLCKTRRSWFSAYNLYSHETGGAVFDEYGVGLDTIAAFVRNEKAA